jgi:hypothetical protein
MSVFAVSKVHLSRDGLVTDVVWGVVDTKSNHWVSPETVASVGEVIAAIRNGDQVMALFPTPQGHLPGRPFVVEAPEDGSGRLVLGASASFDGELRDMTQFER